MSTPPDIRSVLMEEWYKLKDTTMEEVSLWDAFVSLVRDKVSVYLITLKADMTILECIAKGLSVRSIFQKTGIPSKMVRKASFTWGLTPLHKTLDFNPFLVYNSGMTPNMLELLMREILQEPLDLVTCKTIITNIERYKELQEILRKEDI